MQIPVPKDSVSSLQHTLTHSLDQTPLLSPGCSTSLNNYEESFDTVYNDGSTYQDIEDTETGWYIILVVCCACIGGLMFGYDTACISSILHFLDKEGTTFLLKPSEKELVTSITSVGSLFGSLLAASMADKQGRKFILTSCCVIFTIAAIQLSLSNKYWHLVVGRLIVGLAVGAASMIVPVYISEIAPSKKRGTLLALNSISTTGGQFVANLLAYTIKGSMINWRIMFLLSGVPSLLFLLLVPFIPESPRYLVLQGKYDNATTGLTKIYSKATTSQINHKLNSIITDIRQNEEEFSKPFYETLFGTAPTIRALTVGCCLMAFQQATGFNSLMYYGTTIFDHQGLGNPIVVSILISGTNFLFTFVALNYIDKIGRRKTLLYTVWIMSISLFGAAVGFSHSGESASPIYSILLLVSILLFVAGYASGLGTIPWLSVEFLPLEARAPGSSVIASVGWIMNFIVSASYLSMAESSIGISGTSVLFGVLCLIGWFGIYGFYPEVNGLSLEDIRNVFLHGIDIHYSETHVTKT